jgi:two-component system, NtrC family, response regulator HydG
MTEPPLESKPRDSVLIVEDNDIVATVLVRVLGKTCTVSRVDGATDAQKSLDQGPFDVVLCDLRLKDGDGVNVLRHARLEQPLAIRVIMSGGDVPGVEALLGDGTIDASITKPFSGAVFADVVRRARIGRRG